MDSVDQAQDQEAATLADRLDKQLRAAKLDVPGNELCADCAEPIPLARRRAMPSAIRCVNCQAWAERVAKLPGVA